MYIGIDIGGMSIKSGVVNRFGDIVAKYAVPTPLNDNDAFMHAVGESVLGAVKEAGIKTQDIEAFGIGSPGVVDREKGILVDANNIGYNNVPIKDYLNKNIADVPVYVENDANCAALGEYYKSDTSSDFIFITLGTGVGGGIVIGGRLYTGSNGVAGELGHIVTHPDGDMCTCGRRGCWEVYASVTGLKNLTEKHRDEIKGIAPGEEISGRTVFDLARQGDSDAQRVRDMWIEEVSIGIVDMLNIFQPEELVIGGAISKEGEVLLNPIREYAYKYIYSSENLPKKPRIVASRVGGEAGIIGAALLHANLGGEN